MINALPIIGWLLSFIGSVSLSIPFWICWTGAGLGAKYFDFLPEKYQILPFWNCVGLFIILSILKSFSPFNVSSSSKHETKSKS